jgi:hypothetical protein
MVNEFPLKQVFDEAHSCVELILKMTVQPIVAAHQKRTLSLRRMTILFGSGSFVLGVSSFRVSRPAIASHILRDYQILPGLLLAQMLDAILAKQLGLTEP